MALTYPWRLLAVNSGEVGGHPLVLLVGGVVVRVLAPAVDETERAGVVCKGLALGGGGVDALCVGQEVGRRAVGVVGLAVKGDEVDQTWKCEW